MTLECFAPMDYITAVLDVDESSVYEKVSGRDVKALVGDRSTKRRVAEGSVDHCLQFMQKECQLSKYELKIDLASLGDVVGQLLSIPAPEPDETIVIEARRVRVTETLSGWSVYLLNFTGLSEVLSMGNPGSLKDLSKDQLERLFSSRAVVSTLSDTLTFKKSVLRHEQFLPKNLSSDFAAGYNAAHQADYIRFASRAKRIIKELALDGIG